MAVKRRRRRGIGSLSDLQRHLWAILLYNMDVIQDEERPHVLRQKASNCAVQAGMAWLKCEEQADLLKRIEALEAADYEQQHTRNGSHH
jgi:hypothetical protein